MYYYCSGNGTKNLERMRIRTPTTQNIAGMTVALKGCDLADVNMIVLTLDPCTAHGKVDNGVFQTRKMTLKSLFKRPETIRLPV